MGVSCYVSTSTSLNFLTYKTTTVTAKSSDSGTKSCLCPL